MLVVCYFLSDLIHSQVESNNWASQILDEQNAHSYYKVRFRLVRYFNCEIASERCCASPSVLLLFLANDLHWLFCLIHRQKINKTKNFCVKLIIFQVFDFIYSKIDSTNRSSKRSKRLTYCASYSMIRSRLVMNFSYSILFDRWYTPSSPSSSILLSLINVALIKTI